MKRTTASLPRAAEHDKCRITGSPNSVSSGIRTGSAVGQQDQAYSFVHCCSLFKVCLPRVSALRLETDVQEHFKPTSAYIPQETLTTDSTRSRACCVMSTLNWHSSPVPGGALACLLHMRKPDLHTIPHRPLYSLIHWLLVPTGSR